MQLFFIRFPMFSRTSFLICKLQDEVHLGVPRGVSPPPRRLQKSLLSSRSLSRTPSGHPRGPKATPGRQKLTNHRYSCVPRDPKKRRRRRRRRRKSTRKTKTNATTKMKSKTKTTTKTNTKRRTMTKTTTTTKANRRRRRKTKTTRTTLRQRTLR